MSWSKKFSHGASNNITSEEIMHDMGALANIGGVPTHEFGADKDDIDAMQQCVDAEERNYWGQPAGGRISAAPFFFERLAILRSKRKDIAGEIDACQRWVSIIIDYQAQAIVKSGLAALVHKGPRSIAICKRLEKAIAKRDKG